MGYLDTTQNTIISIDFDIGDPLEQKAKVLRNHYGGLYVTRHKSYDSYAYSMDGYKSEINAGDVSTKLTDSLLHYLNSNERVNLTFSQYYMGTISKLLTRDILNYNTSPTSKYTSEKIRSYDDIISNTISRVKDKLDEKSTRNPKSKSNERFYSFSRVLTNMRK